MLRHKHILLAVTGGIAAYKAASLVRLCIKEGAEVRVVMTKSAEDFVTAKTLSVLSKNEVITGFFDAGDNWNNHVHLAEWADMIVVAPLTANTLAKFANGICDNIVCACYLSARSTVYVAPAMDLDMYRHPTTTENIAKLEKQGTVIIPAEHGELASGLRGEGRMAEPENILEFIKAHLSKGLPLLGKHVLVNAGPTYEAIDPVRFIGNRSSGKMGVALADAFADAGATVHLVLGPSNYKPSHKSVTVQRIESAQDMLEACTARFGQVDIAVLSAAVADYRPKNTADQKIKKKDDTLNLELVKTPDVLKTLGQMKQKQILIGFALETEHMLDYAREKLKNKNLDMVVANSAVEAGTGFGVDTNRVTIIDKHNNLYKFELKTKQEIAKDIVNATLEYMRLGDKNMNDPA